MPAAKHWPHRRNRQSVPTLTEKRFGSLLGWFRVMCSKITILFLVFAAGCATESRRLDMLLFSRAIERRCWPESDIQHTGLRMPLAEKSSQERTNFGAADLPADRFPPQSLDIAGTIGTKNLLAQIAALEAESARNVPDFAIQLLLVRQQLSDRILLALLDVKSAAAEANCEEKRADRARPLTIFAVLVGGVAGILSGSLAAADPSSITGGLAAIAAGVVASAFGAAALFDDPRYEFQHGRNLLREAGRVKISLRSFLFQCGAF